MKTGRNNFVKLTVIILTTVLLSSQIFAFNALGNGTTKTQEGEIPEAAIKSLAMGIESGNLGVKKSCIYLAGFYEIKELVKPLTEQLAKETNTGTKILIVLALYKIGDPKAREAVQELVNNDVDPTVKDLGNAVIKNFKLNPFFTKK